MQGFYFCPAARERLTSIYSGLSAVNAIIRPQRQNRLQGFTGAFPLICSIPAHTIQQPHKPPIHRLRHVGWNTVKRSTSTDTRYYRHSGRCAGQRSRPIIIRYIRVQLCALLWIHARQCSISQTVPARRGQLLPSADRWQVLTHYQQYRPGAPSEGSAFPPIQGQPGGLQSGTGSV